MGELGVGLKGSIKIQLRDHMGHRCIACTGSQLAISFEASSPEFPSLPPVLVTTEDTKRLAPGSFRIVFSPPVQTGEYLVHVLLDDEDILESPFKLSIRPQQHRTSSQKVSTQHAPQHGVERTRRGLGTRDIWP